MKFANRMDRFGEGVFSMLAQMKKKKLAEGETIVDLSIGAPNIAPAPHILKALSEACLVPDNYLYAIQDQQALLEAVSEWYARRYGVELNPETEICSLLGSQEGLAHIALSIVDEGDVVLVPDPCYPVFADGPSLAGAELYYMPQREENHYIIDLKEIPEEVAQKAKFMIVSYPNNPTAVLAPDSFYEELIAFAKKYDIIVLHDNAYSELVFDGRTCGSFLRFPGAREVGGKDAGLRVDGLRQLLLGAGEALLGGAGAHGVGRLEDGARRGFGLGEVRAHAGVLGALAGEEERYLTHWFAPARTFSAPFTRSSTISSALWRSFTMPAIWPHRNEPCS